MCWMSEWERDLQWMHVCGGRSSVYEFSYLNGLNTCHHMICSNCTASIWATVVFCSLCICLFANSLNSLSTVELTLFEVSGDFSDMKLVTGHLFKCWGAMAHQKNSTTSSCCSSKGHNVRGEDGRSDTFILTMWNAFIFLNVAKFKTDWADFLYLGRRDWTSQGVLASLARSFDDPCKTLRFPTLPCLKLPPITSEWQTDTTADRVWEQLEVFIDSL